MVLYIWSDRGQDKGDILCSALPWDLRDYDRSGGGECGGGEGGGSNRGRGRRVGDNEQGEQEWKEGTYFSVDREHTGRDGIREGSGGRWADRNTVG